MNQNPKNILNRQKKIYRALIAGGVIVVLGFSYLLMRAPSYAPPLRVAADIDLPADKINPQDVWMNRVESQNQVLDQRLKYLEGLLVAQKNHEIAEEKEKKALKAEIVNLKKEIRIKEEPFLSLKDETTLFSTPAPNEAPLFKPLLIVEASMEEVAASKVKHVDQMIPAGTSVKAVLLSSVDADCGVYSSSDPIPIKLRILDDGHLPKDVEVKLKGGIVIGSAFGNLSNERIHMRLERLTQVKPDGNFVETEVVGYVTGEDGKYGVRGTVVDKSGKIISNAAISGFFSETSSILQSVLGRYTVDNLLTTNQYTVDSSFAPGMNPATGAFDMLSDYYIRRAEQVKPVIQVSAGRIVDITFTYGTEVGDLHTQDQVKKVRLSYKEAP